MGLKFKQYCMLVVFGIFVFVLFWNYESVWLGVLKLIKISKPVLLGLVFAFILNIIMQMYEGLLLKRFVYKTIGLTGNQKKKRENRIHIISCFLAVITILSIFMLIGCFLAPKIIRGLREIYDIVQNTIPEWLEKLEKRGVKIQDLSRFVEEGSIQQLLENFVLRESALGTTLIGLTYQVAKFLISFVIAFIIAIYILLEKRNIGRQLYKLLKVSLPIAKRKRVLHIATIISEKCNGFVRGQVIEGALLGVMIYAGFLLFRIPYASIIAVTTGVLSFVPYVGAIVSCVIGAFFVFVINPKKVVVSIIVFQVIQFIENQFIYPKVVGKSVGLSPLWTLIAILIGGGLFGIGGMILFVPMFATIFELIKEETNKGIKKNK